MRKLHLLLLLLLIAVVAPAQEQLAGPNGNLSVSLALKNGAPVYSVSYKGELFIDESPLGLNTNVGDFTQGLTLSDRVERSRVSDSYSLPNIKKSNVQYEANRAVFSFLKDGNAAFDLIFQVSNNDIAFKYRVHRQGERFVCMVNEEKTGFVFPQGTSTFLCPQMEPMTGFARTGPSYETPYTADDQMGKNGWGYGYTFPGLFRVNDKGWVLLSETGVDSRYCASRLEGHSKGLYTIAYPLPEENNGNGTVEPGMALPGYTPWRTITVGDNLRPIAETTVPWDVAKPLYPASQNYDWGRGTWSWIIKMDESINFEEQKNYIDLSAAMGFEYVLVDNWWDTTIGRDKVEELARYAASKNVSLVMWYNTNGYWNDAPQGPRDIMHRPAPRRAEMEWLKSIGVKGIKVDFFGGDKQVVMQLYEEILYDANDFGIWVVFHGCTLPRGWERMYPNYASSEAVLASEMLHFSQERCDTEAFHASMHPFVRNTVGSMDFGGTVLNQFWNANNTPNVGTKRLTSDVFQLATAVLFQSGIQFFAIAPNNLSDAPKWAIDFLKNVPTTWDEIKYIDGYPGKYVIMARRSGDKWYVAGINAQDEAINMNLELPMFSAGQELKVYRDNAQLQGALSSAKLNKKQTIEVSVPQNGGILITN